MTDHPINPHGSEHDAPQKDPNIKNASFPSKSTGKFKSPIGSPRRGQHLNLINKGQVKGKTQIRKSLKGDR